LKSHDKRGEKVENTNEKLKEVLLKIEEATELYQEILSKLGRTEEEARSKQFMKSVKVLVHEKKTSLDPSVTFEEIKDNDGLHPPIPSGHMVTTFYHRSPAQANITYQTVPTSLKPWLACRNLR
jgi:hypothetical protein